MMGVTAEYFRTLPDVVRSNHPLYSFSVWGKDANWICNDRYNNAPFGRESPLQKLYDLDAKCLFLGTDFKTCTAIHYAESTIGRPITYDETAVLINGKRKWVKIPNYPLEPYDDFLELGAQFIRDYPVKTADLPKGKIQCFSMRALINFDTNYYLMKDKMHF